MLFSEMVTDRASAYFTVLWSTSLQIRKMLRRCSAVSLRSVNVASAWKCKGMFFAASRSLAKA